MKWLLVVTLCLLAPCALLHGGEEVKRPAEPALRVKRFDLKEDRNLVRYATAGKLDLQKKADGFQLYDLVAKKPVGEFLPWRQEDSREWGSQTFRCWALSPDGRYVAVGFGFHAV